MPHAPTDLQGVARHVLIRSTARSQEPLELVQIVAMIEQPSRDAGRTQWLDRIRAEYREMPGLSLTPAQMQRLWGFGPETCTALIDILVSARVLRRTAKGSYVAFDAC